MFKPNRKKSDWVAPLDIIHSHTLLNEHQFPVLSIFVGDYGDARRNWGAYCLQNNLIPLVAPLTDPIELENCYQFHSSSGRAKQEQDVGFLVIPERENLKTLVTLFDFQNRFRNYRLATVISPTLAHSILCTKDISLLNTLGRGLIFIPKPTPPKIVRSSELNLYRSPHEEILHKLLNENPRYYDKFKPNVRRRGESGLSYEIDLFADEWLVALEVDGIDHERNRAQRERDLRRDEDLGNAGIKTIRIKASAIVTDPTNVLSLLSKKLPND